MSRWQVRFPFRDPGSPITDIAIAAQDLEDPEERAVVRALVHQAVFGGCSSAGDFRVLLAGRTPAERRPLLDSARAAAGLRDRNRDRGSRAVRVVSRSANP